MSSSSGVVSGLYSLVPILGVGGIFHVSKKKEAAELLLWPRWSRMSADKARSNPAVRFGDEFSVRADGETAQTRRRGIRADPNNNGIADEMKMLWSQSNGIAGAGWS